MDPFEGYIAAKPGQVCRLKRSLYSFKQASRQWNLELTTRLLEFGFSQSPHDTCLFLKHSGNDFLALLVYVDDSLLTGTSEDNLRAVKQYLDRFFTIKDLGDAKYSLGLELARSGHGLHITQHKYLEDILVDTAMENATPVSTPVPSGLQLTSDAGSLLPFLDKYRRVVGRLLYLRFTRPDISFHVQQLSQFLQHPRTSHWDVALHIIQYLKGSRSLGLFFPARNTLALSTYSDTSWASCLDSRRSIIGFCVFLGSSLVSWKTKKQAIVLALPLKQNIAAWHQLCVNCSGFHIYFMTFVFQFLSLFRFGVTIRPHFTLRPILSSTSAPNILTLIVTW
ncbi:UNVERIFIED_CONTAM: Retrovirus-related Pol polyprotein from transposon RE2 [Sesamum radiatum]|uniref:Retrovirus-related Pol polyprotein from transposon RE2 n=1 Tax=Sesamum radiatum TaxID=300843 RepID=A0AAW2VRB8_SESRA